MPMVIYGINYTLDCFDMTRTILDFVRGTMGVCSSVSLNPPASSLESRRELFLSALCRLRGRELLSRLRTPPLEEVRRLVEWLGLAGVELKVEEGLACTDPNMGRGMGASCLKEELLLLGLESDRLSSAVISTVFSGLGSFTLRLGADLLFGEFNIPPKPCPVSLVMEMEEGRRCFGNGEVCLEFGLLFMET